MAFLYKQVVVLTGRPNSIEELVITEQTINILPDMIKNPEFVDQELIKLTIETIDFIKKFPSLIESLITEESFRESYAEYISNVMFYAQYQESKARSRRLVG